MNFGSWLAQQREQAGKTQREVAGKCGLSPAYVANLERNTSEPPPLETCRSLARVLGIRWEEMWQRAFTARLKRWLKREGYARISESEILDFIRKLESASR